MADKSNNGVSNNKLEYMSLFNVQGLLPKTTTSCVPFIQDFLHDKKQMFVSLTETWLDGQLEAEVSITDYCIYRSDRDFSKRIKNKQKGRSSGGVACYVRKDLAVGMEEVLSFSNGVVECLVLYSKQLNIAIITVYRQPDDVAGKHRSTDREFRQCMNAISEVINVFQSPEPLIFVLGDFNLPKCDWTKSVSSGSAVVKACFKTLIEFSEEFGLTQFIDKPTHIQGNTLDLVLVNNYSLIHSYKPLDVLRSISHHCIIETATTVSFDKWKNSCNTVSNGEVLSNEFQRYNFHSETIKWDVINDALSAINWETELNNLDVNDIVSKFYSICLGVMKDNNIPLRKQQRKKVNYIPMHRRRLMSRRRRAHRRLYGEKKLSLSDKRKLLLKLNDIEKLLMESYDNQRKFNEKKALEAIKNNPKYFYAYAKKFSHTKTDIGPLIDENTEELISDSGEIANILADQFASVYSPINVSLPEAYYFFPDDGSYLFESFDITIDDFIEAIKKIKSITGSGPDGFPAILLKNCCTVLAKPLLILWKKCFDLGITPEYLKTPVVFPLPKKGSKGNKENYRGITNSSHLIKVFERVVHKKLVDFLEENCLLNENQHGFRNGRSCLSELLSHYEHIVSILESNKLADVVYLDFSKAFDKVSFEVIFNKLKSLGIGGKLGRWIYSFLTGRTFRVSVNGFLSLVKEVISGLPQGSVLGPLLFIILLCDIDTDLVVSKLRSFADDSRLSGAVSSDSDIINFQSDLNKVYAWANKNKMVFNDLKFEFMRYQVSSVPFSITDTSYKSSHGSLVNMQGNVVDLGVTMSSDGLFTEHIQKVVKSMKAKSSWITRTFASRSKLVMLKLWKSLVLPIHDYCSQLWFPLLVKDIQVLESIQWCFLKKIHNGPSDYWSALKEFKLYSLQRRRDRYILFYVWKTLEGITPSIINDNGNAVLRNEHSLRRGRLCTVPEVSRKCSASIQTIKRSCFSVYGANLFNGLPKSIRNISNCDFAKFKSAIDLLLSYVPDDPHINGYSMYRTGGSPSNALLSMMNVAQ